LQVGLVEVSLPQISLTEVSSTQVSTAQISASEVSAPEVGINQNRQAEVSPTQVTFGTFIGFQQPLDVFRVRGFNWSHFPQRNHK